jgi:predicted dehydrogenase
VGGAPNSAAGYAHYAATRMDGLWNLKAGVFSRHAENNIEAGKAYGLDSGNIYQSLGELIDNERKSLDAVLILTPTPLHYSMVLECLQAGIPVICEKSLATTSLEAREIKEICHKKDSFLAVTYNYSGYPMVRELRRIIEDGTLGEIIHFQAEMPQEGYLRTDENGNKSIPQEWRQKDGAIPTLHLDLGIHLHQLVHYLIKEKPIELVAQQVSRGYYPVVDNVSCLVRYTSGVQGQFWFSKCAIGHRNGLRLRVYGSKASAEWCQIAPQELLMSYTDGRRQVLDRAYNSKVATLARYSRFKAGHPAGFIEALANLYADIHITLTDYKKHRKFESKEVFGPELAVEGLEFLGAMGRSCSNNNWEKIAI